MRNLPLELIRGLAALYVFASHYSVIEGSNEIVGDWLPFLRFGPEIVMLFFLLSGTVIRLSIDQNPKSRWAFLKNRAIRILPLYWLALAISFSLEYRDGFAPPIERLLGHLFFLQTQEGFITTVLLSNDPLWSLSFEAFFYVLFAIFIGKHQRLLMKLWLFVSLIAIAIHGIWNPNGIIGHFVVMFAYSSIWLVGYYLPDIANRVRVDLLSALSWASLIPLIARMVPVERWMYHFAFIHFLVGLCFVPLILHCLQIENKKRPSKTIPWYCIAIVYPVLIIENWQLSKSSFMSRSFYSVLPLLTIIFVAIVQSRWPRLIAMFPTSSLLLGKLSYAIYVLHFPMIFLANLLCDSFASRLGFVISTVPILTAIGEYVVHPFLVSLIFRKPPRKSLSPG